MVPSLEWLVAGLVLFALLFFGLERAFPARRGQAFLRQGIGTDVAYWFFTPLVTKAITRLVLALVLVLLALALGASPDREGLEALLRPDGMVSRLPWGLQLLALLLLADAVAYGMHRWMHRPGLWPFHAVHHSSPEVDWLSSVRLHPVNDLLVRVAQGVPLVLLGFDPSILAAWVPILFAYSIFVHANVSWSLGPLRFVIATPAFHRWHHAAEAVGLERNFAGLFPVFDLLFGTFHMPRGKAPERYGVPQNDVPEGIAAQLLHPFRRRPAGT
jgi:sterol desaturase/sphingolipid hydroxylase (fatty acid hydroxylase superfamily)